MNYKEFLDKIFNNLEKANICLADLAQLDHFCYRTETIGQYRARKKEFDKLGDMVAENMVNGRPIAVYKFHEPIIYKNYKINCIEIIAPSEARFYSEGLEHIEFVIKNSLEEFMEKYSNLKFIDKRTVYRGDPIVVLEFPDCAVKFHEKPLLEVVKME